MPTKMDLERLIAKGLSSREIGLEYGVVKTTAQNWLRKYDLRTQPSPRPTVIKPTRRCATCDKITPNPRFCSRSCSARTTNSEVPRRKTITFNPCSICNGHITATRYSVHRSCRVNEHRVKYLAAWLRGEIKVSYGSGVNKRLSAIARSLQLERVGYKCESCEWAKRNPFTGLIPLEVDHVNGDPHDDSYDNFAVLCPNCHSLTSTFRGANKGRGRGSTNNNSLQTALASPPRLRGNESGVFTHGTGRGYSRCRCEECLKWRRWYRRGFVNWNGSLTLLGQELGELPERGAAMPNACGTYAMYEHGCRCPECKSAHKTHMARCRPRK